MRKAFALALTVILTCAMPAAAQRQTVNWNRWQSVGPSGVGIDVLEADHGDPDIVYGLTNASGVYQSRDRGETWRDLWVGEHATDTNAFAVSLDHSDDMFIMRTGWVLQLHRSDDGGRTWERLWIPPGDSAPGGAGHYIAMPRDAEGVILFLTVTRGRVMRSEHFGDGWEEVVGLPLQPFSFIEADPYRSRTLWLSGEQSSFVTADGGVSWSEVPGVERILEMAFDPLDEDHILAAASVDDPHSGQGRLYRSTDGGESFSVVPGSPPIFTGLSFDPDRPGTVYGASPFTDRDAGGLYRSLDGGEIWERLAGEGVADGSMNDVMAVEGAASRLLVSSGSGIAASDDGGESWSPSNGGFPSPSIFDLKALATDPPTLVASTSTGVLSSRNSGGTWWPATSDTGSLSRLNHPAPIELDPWDPATVFVMGGQRVYRSTDAGRTFVRVSEERLTDFQLDLHDPTTWYAIRSNDLRLIRSTDQGQSWQEIGIGVDSYISQLLVDPLNPGVLLVIGSGSPWPNMYRSTDGGLTFEQLMYDFFMGYDRRKLRYDPSTRDRLYGERLVSEDGGLTWTEYPLVPSTGFEFPSVFAVDPYQPGELYGFLNYLVQVVGGGIYEVREMTRSFDAGASWERFTMEGLPDDTDLYWMEADRTGTFLFGFGASETGVSVYRLQLRPAKPRRPSGRQP